MPLYTYKHPKTGEEIDVIQKMSDEHIFVDDEGVKWKRIFTVPNASIDTQIDAFSSAEFVNKTRDKGMTMGQLWDESESASKKREKILGKDPLKESHFKKYSKERSGMKHEKDPSKKKGGTIQI